MKNVWKPRGWAVNSVRGSEFEFEFKMVEDCEVQRKGPNYSRYVVIPAWSYLITVVVLLVFFVIGRIENAVRQIERHRT